MSHSLTFKRSCHWLSFDSISSTVEALMERVVSSANNLALVVWRHLGRSLIYNRNKNGPRLDPCGTPHLRSLFYIRLLAINRANLFSVTKIRSKPFQTSSSDTVKL